MLVANWTKATEDHPSVSGSYTVVIDNEKQKDIFYLKAGEEILLKRSPASNKLDEKLLFFLNKISMLVPIKTSGFYEITIGNYGEKLVRYEDDRILWSSFKVKSDPFPVMKKTIMEYKKEKECDDAALQKEYSLEAKDNILVEKITRSLRKEMQDDGFSYAGIKFKVSTGGIKKSVIEAITIEKIIKSIFLYQNGQIIFNLLTQEKKESFEKIIQYKNDFTKHLMSLGYSQGLVSIVTDSMFSFLFSSNKEDIVRNLYCLENGTPGTREQETLLRTLLKFSILGSTRRFVSSFNYTDAAVNNILEFNCLRDIAFYLTLQKSQIVTFTDQFVYEMELEVI